jgi:hypothetical protein
LKWLEERRSQWQHQSPALLPHPSLLLLSLNRWNQLPFPHRWKHLRLWLRKWSLWRRPLSPLRWRGKRRNNKKIRRNNKKIRRRRKRRRWVSAL